MTLEQQCIEIQKQNLLILKSILNARGLGSLKDIPNFGSEMLDTKTAYELAVEAHKGAVDKGGHPYINHPVSVASQFSCTYRICTAYLHDVVEDTEYTVESLIEYGINERVAEAVQRMTHIKSMSYSEYLKVISEDPIAVDVKIADMINNSDMSRLNSFNDKVLARMQKYNAGLKFFAERNFGVKGL